MTAVNTPHVTRDIPDHRYRTPPDSLVNVAKKCRETFLDLIPTPEKLPNIRYYASFNKAALSSLETLGALVAGSEHVNLQNDDDKYHVLCTTKAIFEDLSAYFKTCTEPASADLAASIVKRQSAIYQALESGQYHKTDPHVVTAQLVLNQFLHIDVVPKKRKPTPQGFGV